MFGWLKREKIDELWLWIALGLFMVMIVVNGLAGGTNTLNGLNTADVSDAYANLFTPVGFTFSIWGVIYLMLALFLLRAFKVLKPKKPELKAGDMNQLIVLFSLSSLLNISWLFMWQYQIMSLSVVVMVCLLVILAKVHNLLHGKKMSLKEHILVHAPFSVYFGWISVATIANIAAWLTSLDWDGFMQHETTWTIGMLIAGALVAILVGIIRRDPLYLVVFVWAYFGIIYKHLSVSGHDLEHSGVVVVIAILISVLISTTIQLMREHDQVESIAKLLKERIR